MGMCRGSGKFSSHTAVVPEIRERRLRASAAGPTSCRVLDAPCNTRNAGRRDAAVSSHGSSGTSPELGRTGDRAPASCWSASWNVAVLDLASSTLFPSYPLLPLPHSLPLLLLLSAGFYRFFLTSLPLCFLASLFKRTHTLPGVPADSLCALLFLEPVLLQTREGCQTRVRRAPLTPALFVVQVGPATRAQPAAIALADYFHRQRQQYLFLQHVC